jgi:hypothetical protein
MMTYEATHEYFSPLQGKDKLFPSISELRSRLRKFSVQEICYYFWTLTGYFKRTQFTRFYKYYSDRLSLKSKSKQTSGDSEFL